MRTMRVLDWAEYVKFHGLYGIRTKVNHRTNTVTVYYISYEVEELAKIVHDKYIRTIPHHTLKKE